MMNREQAHDILMKYMKGEAYIQHSKLEMMGLSLASEESGSN